MKKVQAQAFKISPELESIFGEELYSFKGGSEGGASDPTELEEVIVVGYIPDDTEDPWGGQPEEPPIETPTDDWTPEDWENFINDTEYSPDSVELTPEQRWALLHPINAFMAMNNKTAAETASKNLPGQHNGIGDAFRHAYWMFQNAQDFGRTLALELGVAHEDSAQGPAAERAMDLNNNDWGATYGEDHPDATYQDFIDAFNDAVANGDIDILEGGKGAVTGY